jgi:hypothetical protein
MPTIFISYSREDEVWLKQLLKFLSGGLFQEQDVWSDEKIAVGEDWREKIESAIQNASVAILLISQDFLNSAFIMKKEVSDLLRRREAEGISIFPLILRHSTWRDCEPLAGMQAHPRDGQPLDGRSRAGREKELAAFARQIAKILKPPSDEADTERYWGKGAVLATPKNAAEAVADAERRTRHAVGSQVAGNTVPGPRAAELKPGRIGAARRKDYADPGRGVPI